MKRSNKDLFVLSQPCVQMISWDNESMIFIPGNVPSLKNGKIKTSRGIFSSKAVVKFIRNLGIQKFSSTRKEVTGYKDPNRPNQFEVMRPLFEKMMEGKQAPVIIGMHQIRNSRRAYDWSNSVELIQDLLTAHDFIEDDNIRFMYPAPMTKDGRLVSAKLLRDINTYSSVDKNNPGVVIRIF